MTTENKSARVRLGPIATALIEGQEDNRQQALDDAIQSLQERAESSNRVDGTPALPTAVLTSLAAAVERNSQALTDLAAITATELKLTRVLIASLMTTASEEQQQLIEMTDKVIKDLHSNSRLLGAPEQEKLEDLDAAQRALVGRELQRGVELDREVQEEELER